LNGGGQPSLEQQKEFAAIQTPTRKRMWWSSRTDHHIGIAYWPRAAIFAALSSFHTLTGSPVTGLMTTLLNQGL
jgi:hypothetical protein